MDGFRKWSKSTRYRYAKKLARLSNEDDGSTTDESENNELVSIEVNEIANNPVSKEQSTSVQYTTDKESKLQGVSRHEFLPGNSHDDSNYPETYIDEDGVIGQDSDDSMDVEEVALDNDMESEQSGNDDMDLLEDKNNETMDFLEELQGEDAKCSESMSGRCKEFSDSLHDLKEQPLYEGAPVNVFESLILILTIALKHNLSGTCVADLLILVSLHCMLPNACRTSLYHFRKILSNLESPIKFHYFCSLCYTTLETRTAHCPNSANHPDFKGIDYFIEIPLILQLQKLFQRKNVYEQIGHRFSRQNNFEIGDIYDGKLYKSFCGEHGFLSNRNNVSLMWYTDGVPVYKSSNRTLWPVYFCVNELPRELRYKKENMIMAGLWYGKKPEPNVFLRPLYCSLKEAHNGFQISPQDTNNILMRAMLLCGTCDLPARCMFTGFIQYNGAYGCPYCKIKGTNFNKLEKAKASTTEASPKGNVWIYPFDSKEEQCMRNHEEVIKHAKTYLKFKETKTKASSYFGVKEPCLMSKMMPDIIKGMGIDVMHCVFINIVKKLIGFWFEPKYRKESFSISKWTQVIDDNLKKIYPPYFIKRSTRSINESLKYWKASEFKNFFFYYSIPLLIGVLPAIYLDNFCDLVFSIYTLSKISVSMDDVAKCRAIIRRFTVNYQKLYGERYMTMNIHLLQHLPFVVENLGPLWVYSCFRFEDFNGQILKLVKGTRYADMQIANNILMLWNLPLQIDSLTSGKVKYLCKSLINGNSQLKKTERISSGVYSVGVYQVFSEIPVLVITSLVSEKITASNCLIFQRLKKDGIVYASKGYCDNFRSDNYYVKFLYKGDIKYGIINYFIRISDCACTSSSCRCLPAKFLAILTVCEISPLSTASVSITNISHIKKITISDESLAVDVLNLNSVLINIAGRYTCEPVNLVEVE